MHIDKGGIKILVRGSRDMGLRHCNIKIDKLERGGDNTSHEIKIRGKF
jgi:hypothetical protein